MSAQLSNAVAPVLANNALPLIAASGLTVGLQLFATLPPSAGSKPLANVEAMVPGPGARGPGGANALFVVDQRGIIYRTDTSGAAPVVYLDLRSQGLGLDAQSGEQGLVGLAFHPNFAGDPSKPGYGTFYTDYAAFSSSGTTDFNPHGDASHHQIVREWTATNPSAGTFAGTSRQVLSLGKAVGNHNGGAIGFNPNASAGSADYGLLYIGVGDDGAANDTYNNAQDVTSPYGKILRIDPLRQPGGVAYGIPSDNPFTGQAGAAPLVWAYGLRNPQQFSWEHGGQGRLFIDDIGQNQIEEVDLGAKGANYGWQLRAGDFATGYAVGNGKGDGNVYLVPGGIAADGLTYPIAEYSHSEYVATSESSAIGSGFVYHGSAIPTLIGKYVFADFVQGRMFFIDPANAEPGGDRPIQSIGFALPDGSTANSLAGSSLGEGSRADLRLGEDANGELYALLKGPGAVYQIVPTAAAPGSNIIALGISEDAYLGHALYTVAVDGKQIGGTRTATASHTAGQTQTVVLEGAFGVGPHIVTVGFLNDAYGGSASTDRNLYVDNLSQAGNTGQTRAVLYSAGSALLITPTRQVTTVGTGPDAITLSMSEDAYLGHAQFTVAVDGQQVGGTLTAAASHAAGEEQDIRLNGSFGPGTHSVAVNFLNDAWAGTAATDRNLYVDRIAVSGVSLQTSAGLFSAGSAVFATPAPQATTIGTGPDVITLSVSEDAYLGDAQFAVEVNGQQIGGIQTATASHSAGVARDFIVRGSFGPGAKIIGMRFLNDAWGGTAATDRNLYIDSIRSGGTTSQTNGALFEAGRATFLLDGTAVTAQAAGPMVSVAAPASVPALTTQAGTSTLFSALATQGVDQLQTKSQAGQQV